MQSADETSKEQEHEQEEEEEEEEWLEVEPPKEYDAHGFLLEPELEELSRAAAARDARRAAAHDARWRSHGVAELEAGQLEAVRELARGGVPDDLRASVWMALAAVDQLRALHGPAYYEECAERGARARTDATAQIDLDLGRTFPGHGFFETVEGVVLLRRVLAAFADHDPHIGYVQGMSFVTGLLLIVTRYARDGEDAFWLLVALATKLLPLDYFTPAMLGLRVDQALLAHLLDSRLPRLARHLESCGACPDIYATKWLLCAYVTAMPVATVLRIWDALFADGNCVLLRVALAFLRAHERALLASHDQGELLTQLAARARVHFDSQQLLAAACARGACGRELTTELCDQLRAQTLPLLVAAARESPRRPAAPADEAEAEAAAEAAAEAEAEAAGGGDARTQGAVDTKVLQRRACAAQAAAADKASPSASRQASGGHGARAEAACEHAAPAVPPAPEPDAPAAPPSPRARSECAAAFDTHHDDVELAVPPSEPSSGAEPRAEAAGLRRRRTNEERADDELSARERRAEHSVSKHRQCGGEVAAADCLALQPAGVSHVSLPAAS